MKRLAALFIFTACSSIPSLPYRACLYSRVGGRDLFLAGRVIATDGEGRKLFQFDDQTQGDRGFRWLDESSAIRPCPAVLQEIPNEPTL